MKKVFKGVIVCLVTVGIFSCESREEKNERIEKENLTLYETEYNEFLTNMRPRLSTKMGQLEKIITKNSIKETYDVVLEDNVKAFTISLLPSTKESKSIESSHGIMGSGTDLFVHEEFFTRKLSVYDSDIDLSRIQSIIKGDTIKLAYSSKEAREELKHLRNFCEYFVNLERVFVQWDYLKEEPFIHPGEDLSVFTGSIKGFVNLYQFNGEARLINYNTFEIKEHEGEVVVHGDYLDDLYEQFYDKAQKNINNIVNVVYGETGIVSVPKRSKYSRLKDK